MAKVLFGYMKTDMDELRSESNKWCLLIFIAGIVSFFIVFLGKFSFGVVGENITLKMRHLLYTAIVKKHLGWFDIRDNAPGVLTSILANEA